MTAYSHATTMVVPLVRRQQHGRGEGGDAPYGKPEQGKSEKSEDLTVEPCVVAAAKEKSNRKKMVWRASIQ